LSRTFPNHFKLFPNLAGFYFDRLLAQGTVSGDTITVDDAVWRAALEQRKDPAKAAANGESLTSRPCCGD
jgi:hypothetical protein